MKFEDVARGYANLWAKMKIRPEHDEKANKIAIMLAANPVSHQRYMNVAENIGCPWWFIAIIHELEAGGDFTKHLHNGDPLTARTVHVPAGRPVSGEPPFTWENSAEDALRMRGIDKIRAANWSIPRALFEWEAYNGLAYFSRGINSPYVWSFSNLYTSGKYIADHVYDPNAVSAQCGAAVILRAMIDLGYVVEPQQETAPMDDLKKFIDQFALFAPLLATAIGGPAAGLAVKAIAEAVGADPTAAPEAVHDQLQALPASKIGDTIKQAEQIMTSLQPAPSPAKAATAPVSTQTPAPVATGGAALDIFDRIFAAIGIPAGTKSYLFGALLIATYVASTLHLAPNLLTPEVATSLEVTFAGLTGAALLARIQRIAGLFGYTIPIQ